MKDRLSKLAVSVRGRRVMLLEYIGFCLFLSGCWCIYRPLPFLVGGAALLGLGFLIDYTERKP